MRFTFIPALVLCLVLTRMVQAQSFELRVKHDHTLGSCEGNLIAGSGDSIRSSRW